MFLVHFAYNYDNYISDPKFQLFYPAAAFSHFGSRTKAGHKEACFG